MKNESNKSFIKIRGARENNLQNIDIDIPKGKLVAICGISGSGKSSLVHDIIYKEAQRLFVESLSIDSRRLMKSYAQVNVDSIIGLSPVVAVGQRKGNSNIGSTVGTLSGIYDLLRLLMARFGKPTIDISPLKQERRLFSFNTPYGACPNCRGLGIEENIDSSLIIKDPKLSLREGALSITTPSGYTIYSQVTIDVMSQVCQSEGFDVDTPWDMLTEANKKIIFYGSDKIKVPFGKHSLESRMKWTGITAKPREEGYYRGIIPIMEEILKRDRNVNILRFVSTSICSQCNGARLNKQALSINFSNQNITSFSNMHIEGVYNFFNENRKVEKSELAFAAIKDEILKSCKILMDLGLGYLQIKREAFSLSTGESQRIRLANMAQSSLSGLLYIFDEPSVGLHPSDQAPLIKLLYELRDKGNTVLLIEHEHKMIMAADWIIDIGPKAGNFGGELIFSGSIKDFFKKTIKRSISQKYLLKKYIKQPKKANDNPKFFKLLNTDIHNLKHIDINFRLEAINVVCGVSGSGKSSLVIDTLDADINRKNYQYIVPHSSLPSKSITIDQSPIGRSPRSNPATYTKVFDKIRALFSKLDKAKTQKLKSSHFSFNIKGGRCENCQGAGYNLVGMHFIGNVEVVCNSCKGNRFQQHILNIRYRSKNIKEVLDMPISEAVEFFNDKKDIYKMLKGMADLGLGYLSLGQRATSLSGGEAQRIKLASQMIKNAKQPTLYILDEPSTGLHAFDVEILLISLQKLKKQGHTIVIVEHHEDIIRAADHIIELGPGSGKNGGNLVFEGTLEQLIKINSLTSQAINTTHSLSTMDSKPYSNQVPYIEFKGVKTNNLQNIDIKILKNKFIVFTGISGSGKSSMAIDTLFKVGRDTYFETFPTYVRSRLNNKSDAKYDSVKGLTACLSIEHKKSKASLRSTIGTYSGIFDLYRLLYSRISKNINNEVCTFESGYFSFNKQESACKTCKGLGEITIADSEAFINNPEESIYENAISKSKIAKFYTDKNGQYYWTLKALDKVLQLNIDMSWNELSESSKDIVLFGDNKNELEVEWKFEKNGHQGSHNFKGFWKGLIPSINEEYQRKSEDNRALAFNPIMKQVSCPICKGKRLSYNVLNYIISGFSIIDLSDLTISNSILLLEKWQNNFEANKQLISNDIIDETIKKLSALESLDLGYLQLSRNLNSISGGEMQRISLASSLSRKMSGISYIFDEPSRALHPKNRLKVLEQLKQLKSSGNTVIVVEHSPEFIRNADMVFEFGPGAGSNGGKIIRSYTPNEIEEIESPIIRKYRRKKENPKSPNIIINNAVANNLKSVSLQIPSNQLISICGVSGSGKTSLVQNVIYQSYKKSKFVDCKNIDGLQQFDECIFIDADIESSGRNQSIITYLGLFDSLKKQMSQTPKAKLEKIKPNFFSYLSKEGKCANCNGLGKVTIKMDFISDVEEVCPECHGSCYKSEVLNYNYNGLNIAEILALNISDAKDYFPEKSRNKIELLEEIGLSYLTLNQRFNNLSLGEIQRLKLARYLTDTNNSKILFLLDEPSKGLSLKDIQSLLNILDGLLQKGHSIIMVEHHSEVLSASDYIIELGPDAAEKGGEIIAEGEPLEIKGNIKSIIREFLPGRR